MAKKKNLESFVPFLSHFTFSVNLGQKAVVAEQRLTRFFYRVQVECRRGDSNPHGLPHTPLKRTCLPVPPLRRLEGVIRCDYDYCFWAGDAAGEATGLAAGLADVTGDAAGLTLAAGEAAGLGEGEGCVVTAPSRTTELGPLNPGSEKSKARNIKTMAAITVAFSRGFCAPRGPKAVWLPDPPKAAATSPPFPDCKSTTRIRKMQANTKIPVRIYFKIKVSYLP